MNVLIVLGVLFLALIIIVPLVERFGKPAEEEQMQSYGKWMMIAMSILMVASTVKYCGGI